MRKTAEDEGAFRLRKIAERPAGGPRRVGRQFSLKTLHGDDTMISKMEYTVPALRCRGLVSERTLTLTNSVSIDSQGNRGVTATASHSVTNPAETASGSAGESDD